MKKKVVKSSWIATIISVLSGIANMFVSWFKGSGVVGGEAVQPTLPWLQSLFIMIGVFVIVFVVLLIYYFVIKKKVEEIPNPR